MADPFWQVLQVDFFPQSKLPLEQLAMLKCWVFATHLQPMAKTKMATCSHWSFWMGVVFLFFPSTFKETLQHYMNLIRNLQNDPENSEKKCSQHFFTSSSNFWCIGVCGSSSAKRRTESSLAEKIVQQESLTCSCLMENSIIS